MLETIIKAALSAGREIMEIYVKEDFDVDFKRDNSPLTIADIRSHDIIMEQLKKTNIPVLSEEGKNIPYEERKNWKKLWIVDPIDGTKEFIKRNGEFTVNIALVEDHVPIMGVIYAPALQILYYGTGKQAFRIENVTLENYRDQANNAQLLPVQSNTNGQQKITIVASKSHLSGETKEYIDSLQLDYAEVTTISKGSSLKLCMVAEGSAQQYPRFAPTMEWDTAAGQAICTSAGFDVIDLNTKKTMTYNRVNLLNDWFLVK